MAKCNVCKNEKILCICPKGLGGGSETEASKGDERDAAYDKIVNQVTNAILQQYVNIHREKPRELPAFMDNLRIILDDESAGNLLKLLEEGIATKTDAATFEEEFKNLNPNMAMLNELSHKFNLDIFPSPANQLVTGIKLAVSILREWPPYPDIDGGNFHQALQSYVEYYKTLSSEQQSILRDIFWAQINKLGTPVIEFNPKNPSECNVYFLLPKDRLAESKEVQGTKKDLYLQGDFHGYNFTQDRQRVSELDDTSIMLKQNSLPRDAIITYRYIQLEPIYRDLSATQIHGSDAIELPPSQYFPNESEAEKEKPVIPPLVPDFNIFQEPDTDLKDDNTLHRPPYFEFNGAERIFRVNPEPNRAQLGGKQINWSILLSSTNEDVSNKHFKHSRTLYSHLNGDLRVAHPSDSQKPNAEPMQLHDKKSVYANCTRAIHVFTPTSDKIDNIVIINDGIAYLALDVMSTFEHMVEEGNLSKNTAFVFITALPALSKTMSVDDPKANMPGMGERTIDYQHGIDNYVEFISNSLLPTLEKQGLELPTHPNCRIMIGSSLSGTASIYIGSKHPELVGGVIAQSPSPSNRIILKDIVDNYNPLKPRAYIQLSCGYFEQPGFAENTMVPFAKELSERLKVPLNIEPHGHQHLAWTDELKHFLPAIMEMNNLIKLQND